MKKSYKIQLKSHETLIIPSKSHKKPLVDQDGGGSDYQPQPPASALQGWDANGGQEITDITGVRPSLALSEN